MGLQGIPGRVHDNHGPPSKVWLGLQKKGLRFRVPKLQIQNLDKPGGWERETGGGGGVRV